MKDDGKVHIPAGSTVWVEDAEGHEYEAEVTLPPKGVKPGDEFVLYVRLR